jgi:uncharacterized protein (TIGR00299 family) protein
MSILYYDCFSGISGDMNLAAMLALGVNEGHLRSELTKLNLSAEFDLQVADDAKCGINGKRVDVILKSASSHTHHHPAHRHLKDIDDIISGCDLSDSVKATSLAIFRRIAVAEAHVHNCSVDEIHFHEVGATDAIVDIVGAAICRDALGVDQVLCSSVELGGGFVTCDHGRLPVPAPATVEILHGIPTRRGAAPFETTTPTGAAILAELVDQYTDTPAIVAENTAYGIGHRDMEIPNVLRVQLGTRTEEPTTGVDAILLECTIDDMTAEALGYAMERLLDGGASDVNFIPATTKKSRPATIVSVLCAPDREADIQRIMFRETTTLGIKCIAIRKSMLDRDTRTCETRFGAISMKQARLDGAVIRAKPEFEECAAMARRENVPLTEVYRAVAASTATTTNEGSV